MKFILYYKTMDQMPFIASFLGQEFGGNSLFAWIAALGIFWAVFLSLFLLRRRFLKKLRSNAAGSLWRKVPHAFLARTHPLFLFLIALIFALSPLEFSAYAVKMQSYALVIGAAAQLFLWAQVVIGLVLERIVAKRTASASGDVALLTALVPIKFSLNLLAGVLIAILALDNMGVNVTALVAGLGIGGIAIALAVQGVLQDLFSAVSIVMDKPFMVGDFIVIGNKMGTVEQIGLKTTRIRALSGEQLIFSNKDLLSSQIQNFKRMQERRVQFSLGLVYQTEPAKLRSVPNTVKSIIERQRDVRFERCHLKNLGDYALEFEVVYWVLNPDYNLYMDRHHQINLDILQNFTQSGIDFAYPTNTNYEFQHVVERQIQSENAA